MCSEIKDTISSSCGTSSLSSSNNFFLIKNDSNADTDDLLFITNLLSLVLVTVGVAKHSTSITVSEISVGFIVNNYYDQIFLPSFLPSFLCTAVGDDLNRTRSVAINNC
jgi:hypothetical protein